MARIHGRYPRVPCLVPGCRCGATCYPPAAGLEIICPKHYRLVDRRLKTARRRAVRLKRWSLAALVWRRIRRQAIERATGIG